MCEDNNNGSEKKVNVVTPETAEATFSGNVPTIDTRYVFTGQFLQASAIFVRRAIEIETSSAATPPDEATKCEHRGLVCSVIMQCAAALETEAHETCKHGPGAYLNSTNIQARDFLLPLADFVDYQNTLDRFDLILHLLQRPPFDKGRDPYQSAKLVVRLRNELVHYKSRWGREMERGKLYGALQALRHKAPPFTDETMNFFPNRCLSAECAKWAQASTVKLLECFYASLGVPNRFRDYRSSLNP
jgi:hypothetical protein